MMLRTCLSIFGASAVFGQQFEVATIKSPPPQQGEWIRVAMDGGPGTPDPGRINYENVTLKMLLAKAYGVQYYQISGPYRLESETFNIAAKLPDNADQALQTIDASSNKGFSSLCAACREEWAENEDFNGGPR